MKLLNNNRAFSIIELVVVITVIAILAMIGIPSYVRYIQRASLAEAISVLSGYKDPFGLMWSVQSKLPTTGDTLSGSIVDLPFDSVMSSGLPDSIQSIQLTSSGNGRVIKLILKADVFSTYPLNNRQLALGAKISGNRVLFECGNLSTNASGSGDIGFIDQSILPKGCNYNGVAEWLAS